VLSYCTYDRDRGEPLAYKEERNFFALLLLRVMLGCDVILIVVERKEQSII
jgi:hypothetical protein